MAIVSAGESETGPSSMQSWALWNMAFRPFYLGATAFSALTMMHWALQWSGMLGDSFYTISPLWHAHEMLFGYALAVIVGFLLTAARVWTGRPTLSGKPLAVLFCLWVISRVLVLTPFLWASAVSNVAFVLLAAIALARPILASGNRRNYFFLILLALFCVSTFSIHLAMLGLTQLPGWAGVRLTLDLVLLIMVIMTGRVVPVFSNNGIVGHRARNHRLIDIAAPLSIVALLIADLSQASSTTLVAISSIASLVHGSRLILWKSHKTGSAPLVWVLHVAYLAIVVHLLLRTLNALGVLDPSLATHSLTVGALGTLTFGMMVRTSRGHLGMPLIADRADVFIFVLIITAAVFRIIGPAISTNLHNCVVVLSSSLWAAAALLFIVRYGFKLCRSRLDGKPG